MAKKMAYVENNVVTNMEWVPSEWKETDRLKDIQDRPVTMGDTYENGKWYRDGVEILTREEELEKRIAELEAMDADKTAALHELGVYA